MNGNQFWQIVTSHACDVTRGTEAFSALENRFLTLVDVIDADADVVT